MGRRTIDPLVGGEPRVIGARSLGRTRAWLGFDRWCLGMLGGCFTAFAPLCLQMRAAEISTHNGLEEPPIRELAQGAVLGLEMECSGRAP